MRGRGRIRLEWLRQAPILLLIVGACTLTACSRLAGEPKAPPSSAASAGESVKSAQPDTGKGQDGSSLAGLPEAVAQLERLRESIDRISKADPAEQGTVEGLEAARAGLQALRAKMGRLQVDELAEIHRIAITSGDWTLSKDEVVTSRLQRVERKLARVAEQKATMTRLSALADVELAPPGIRLLIETSLASLDDLEKRLVARRTEVLVAVERLAEVRGSAAALVAEAEGRIEAAKDDADRFPREPIWRIRFAGTSAFGRAVDRLHRDGARVLTFVIGNGPRFLLVSLLVFGATGALLACLRRSAPREEGDPANVASDRIRQISWVAAVPLTAVLIALSAPPAPPAFYELALLSAAPAAAWIVVKVLGPGMARTVWVLAASVAIFPLRGALESLPLVGRLVFLLQTLPLAAVLVLDFREQSWKDRIPNRRFAGVLQKIAWLLAALLATAAAGTIAGRLRTSTRLGLGALGTLAGIVMVAATYLVLVEVLRTIVSSQNAKRFLSVRHRAADVLAFATKTLRAVALAACVVIALVSFELLAPAMSLLRELFSESVQLGSLSISVGSVVSFVLVFVAALLLSSTVTFVLNEELLPRLELARGVAYAISVSTRYLLLFGGFVLASGAAGIDLSKVGFLAGALGVGIGFGLQNIVSNFISGLILLFERPIQVGDMVDVSGAAGTVTHIGIRASTVRSVDGAEVVVPNADLISKPLVNWTLSDRRRRFDVVVGVAYGSPLEGTAQALLAAAKRTPGVLVSPAPEAFFQTFAASSLDWALRVWVQLDEASKVLSDLKRSVSEEVERAGIEIPFPQQEIRIRSGDPHAAGPMPERPGMEPST